MSKKMHTLLQPPILALETATDVCSVALVTSNGQVMEHRSQGRGIHSSHTFIYVQALLQEAGLQVADLNGVVVSAGPGSYTGLRVGSSAVKGLLHGTQVPLFAVSTLGAIALGKALVTRVKDGLEPGRSDASGQPVAPAQFAEPGQPGASGESAALGQPGASGQSATPIHPNNQMLPGSYHVHEPLEFWPPDAALQVDAVLDARRQHVYHQPWQVGGGHVKALGPVRVLPLDQALERWRKGAVLAGTGLERLNQLAKERQIVSLKADGTGLDADYEVLSAAHVLRFLQVLAAGEGHADGAFLREVHPAEFEPDYYAEPS